MRSSYPCGGPQSPEHRRQGRRNEQALSILEMMFRGPSAAVHVESCWKRKHTPKRANLGWGVYQNSLSCCGLDVVPCTDVMRAASIIRSVRSSNAACSQMKFAVGRMLACSTAPWNGAQHGICSGYRAAATRVVACSQ